MTLIQLFVVLALVALNGFFVAAEFSLVTVRPTRVEQLQRAGEPRAAVVKHLLADLDRVLNGVQLGITIASLSLGWLGELTLARLIEPVLASLDIRPVEFVAHGIAITVAFLIITFLHVVLGEMVPKSMSLQRSEKLALAVARPMNWFMTLFRPVIDLLDSSSRVILRAIGYRAMRSSALVHSADELRLALTQMRERGLVSEREDEMFEGALELKWVQVHEVMTPRRDLVGLPVSAGLEQVLWTVRHHGYDRYPVYETTPEATIGILHTQDLFQALEQILHSPNPDQARRSFDLRRTLRTALFVPETRTLGALLEDFRRKRVQVALVVDEHGSVQGMVTLADIIEEITGRVADEHAPARPWPMVTETGLVVEGKTNLQDLEHEHEIDLPRGGGFETLAGFVLSRLGYIPAGGESFLHDSLRFTVLEVEGHRIAKVKIEKLEARG
ncbi:MAG: HlyC/CorC family transporter [Acidobacteria bacterium]|nr:HlyC/CorC family transporter [Acidobacteriota bacterium]